MMTREEALKLLENKIYKWSMDWDEREDGLDYTEAIEIAIAALRHQIWEDQLWHDAKTDPPKTPGLYYGKRTTPTPCMPVSIGMVYGCWICTHSRRWTLFSGRIIQRL